MVPDLKAPLFAHFFRCQIAIWSYVGVSCHGANRQEYADGEVIRTIYKQPRCAHNVRQYT